MPWVRAALVPCTPTSSLISGLLPESPGGGGARKIEPTSFPDEPNCSSVHLLEDVDKGRTRMEMEGLESLLQRLQREARRCYPALHQASGILPPCLTSAWIPKEPWAARRGSCLEVKPPPQEPAASEMHGEEGKLVLETPGPFAQGSSAEQHSGTKQTQTRAQIWSS
ncbi:hypothetical protein CB1_001533069 [Camelus ferus]|nr:hypothetical protein CB1_001533069 [Camelus ferus]